MLQPTQLESGAHSSEETGLTMRQEFDIESVASVNRDNKLTVLTPVDASAADLERVGSRRIRRLVLVGANPPQNQVAEEISQLQILHLNQEIHPPRWPRTFMTTRFHRILTEISS